ncbi:hypothetical protein SAMN05216553_107458 [Lentzea fradiae]|uniref:Uncharacterized protein n=1 Tax=Lentzea fradiae TaxID=200378 RepID=A0A1G7TVJ8_9PSEU|nr:hypothetical protein [Lentzea fradiae]SDG38520.1 hypothetical protein SAMN05216553_107458 [Lentzea fradiae]
MTRTPPLAAVALVAVAALQPPTSSEPPPVSSSPPAPTTTTSEPPPTSTTTSTAPPSTTSASEPTPPPGTEPPAPTSPAPPPPAPAPVAAGGREWTLTASRLELGGLHYAGVVDAVVDGQVVRVLKFTASDMKIRDLVQSAGASPDRRLVTAARPGSTSTVTTGPGGRIELFTVQLKGDLDVLGIKVPVDYSAAHPPPLDVPFAVFTDVTVRNTDLVGGTLTIPGSRTYLVEG